MWNCVIRRRGRFWSTAGRSFEKRLHSIIRCRAVCSIFSGQLQSGVCAFFILWRYERKQPWFVWLHNSVRLSRIQINQPTRCNSFTSLLLDVYVWLNMFRAPLRPSSGAYNCTRSLWFYRWSIVGRGLAGYLCQTTTNNASAASLQQ
jgi:hypothetical protein